MSREKTGVEFRRFARENTGPGSEYLRAHMPVEPARGDRCARMHELNADVLRQFRARIAASARENSPQASVREMQRLAARHAELVQLLQQLRVDKKRRREDAA